jgi:hypothetical protein
MEISDLGASETGLVLQPLATSFNATMLAAGALILAAAWFAHRALHRRTVTIPTGLLGIGVLGVGVFPGTIHPTTRCSPTPPLWPEGWPCVLLWLVGFGGYLTTSPTAEVSRPSRPGTAARSLDDHREDARSSR